MAKQDSSKNSKIAPVIGVVAKAGGHVGRLGSGAVKGSHSISSRFISWFKGKSRKVQLILTAVVVVIVGGIIGVTVWQSSQYKVPPPDTKFTRTSLLQQVNQLEKEGRYSDAQKLLSSQAVKNNYAKPAATNGAVSSATDVSERSVMALTASNYITQKNYTAALAEEQQIEQKYGLDSGLAVAIAQLEVDVHNTQAAKDYYNKALTILQAAPQIPPVKAQISSIQSTLKTL